MSFNETADGTSLHDKDWGAGRRVLFVRGGPLDVCEGAPHAPMLARGERLNQKPLAFAHASR